VSDRVWTLRNRHDREIAALAVPALGALIADPLLSLVDTAFIGRLGEEELGALGVAAAVFAIAFFIFNFLEYATTTMVANAVGAGDPAAAGRRTVSALLVAWAVGLAVVAVLEVATEPILSVMGAEGRLRDLAAAYIRIRALAAPAVLTVRAAHGAFRGYQDTRTPLAVTLVINGINLVLDPLLIFGLGWGVAGAAWATVAAQWLGAGWFVALLLVWRRSELGLVPGRIPLAALRPFLQAGRDIVIRTAALLSVFTLATAVATRISETAVAAHQVVFQVWAFLALAVDALAIAAQALIGRYLGAGEPEAAHRVADRLVALGLAVGGVLAAVLAGLRGPLPTWFTDEPLVIESIRSIYWFLVAAMPLAAVVFVWDGVFLGAGDFGFLAVAMVGAALVGVGVLLAVIPLEWGLVGVWWGVTCLMAARIGTLTWRRLSRSSPLRDPMLR
jgi:MATE family multidrug resistance protein